VQNDHGAKIKPKPQGLEKPFVPKIIRAMSKLHVAVYRSTGGLLGSKWRMGAAFPRGVPVLLLTTVGRKSGEPRTTPLLFIEDGDDIVIVASKGGLPKDPLWYKNLQANPNVEIQINGRRMKMKARTANPSERTRLWPKLVAHYPDFASYETWTDREIPVVICEPA
jgi:deazaflavin-dependent oxidoreductase (nitroreductase family)